MSLGDPVVIAEEDGSVLSQSIADKMGIAGVPEGGGEGGVGVEAAAVVVITLLAVLGNAMVVATLVRRSMLQHPSNRLVLSLTGSNLILTVVVLPGMVTSLLMTPASPIDCQTTLTHLSNNSERPSSRSCNDTASFSCNPNLPSGLSQQNINGSLFSLHYLNGSSELQMNRGFSNSLEPEITSSIPSKSYTTDAFVSSHFVNGDITTEAHFPTQAPRFKNVVTVDRDSPVSLDEETTSDLSQQWDDTQSGHVGTDSHNQEEYITTSPRQLKHHTTEPELTSVNRNVETSEIPSYDAFQSKNNEQLSAKDILAEYEYLEDQKYESLNRKEIQSRSVHVQKSKVAHRDSSIGDELNEPNHHHKHVKETPLDKNSILVETDQMEEDPSDEVVVDEKGKCGKDRASSDVEGNRHTARRRKQETHHHHHHHERHRRSRESHTNNQRQTKIQGEFNDIKHLNNKNEEILPEYMAPGDDITVAALKGVSNHLTHVNEQDHVKQEPKNHIKQLHETGKHIILVRGVQEIEEEQEKQLLLLVVDQEEPRAEQKQIRFQFQPAAEELQKPVELNQEEDYFNMKHSSIAIVDRLSPSDDNHSFGEAYQELPLPHEQVMNKLELEVHQKLREIKEEEELDEEGQVEEQEVEEVQQIYAGVEWESDRWEGGKILCQGAAFFTNLISAASALTVAVIAIDRYLAIVRPLVYGAMVTSGRCLLMLAWCWGQALLTALPPLLGWARYERREPYGRCGVAWGNSPSYTAVWTISVFLIPFSIMVVCYYHILQVARNKCKKIRVGKVSETSPPITPVTGSTCLEGFPFPLSVEHLTSPPMGSKSAHPTGPVLGIVPPSTNLSNPHVGDGCHLRNYSSHQGNGPGPPFVRNASVNGGLDSYLDKAVPCRSYSVSGILRVTDSTNTNDSANKPKRKLADFGRSRSLCQVPQQPPRPCLRRVQSTFSVRHTLKKLSIGTRRPSWNSEGSPSKGFWTVFVVMGAHILTWGPYTFMAVAEAILGRERLLLLPHWVSVTCTLLLFTASVFYPIVYGLYNRNIRKELLSCLCPSWSRRRGSHLRRPSTVPSYSGSVLDFNALRQRGVSDKPEHSFNPSNGISETVGTISSTVGSLACPSPLMILTDADDPLPTRGYNLNHRKPSQDSGTVMVGSEDQDSDSEVIAPTPHQYTTRRVSAPSVLSTVREDPHTTTVSIEEVHQHISRHHSMNSRNSSTQQRRMPIIPLSIQVLNSSRTVDTSLRRSLSLDKIHSSDKDKTLDSKITYRSLRKKRSNPLIRETPFNTPPASERIQRRRGSLAVVKVMSIPEDSGLPEYPEVTDSGRGSVDSGNVSKTRVVSGRGSVDSADLTKTYSLRCSASVDSTDLSRIQAFSRRGSVDSTELAMARAINKRHSGDSVDLEKIPTTRQVSIDEGIGGDCLPEEVATWE